VPGVPVALVRFVPGVLGVPGAGVDGPASGMGTSSRSSSSSSSSSLEMVVMLGGAGSGRQLTFLGQARSLPFPLPLFNATEFVAACNDSILVARLGLTVRLSSTARGCVEATLGLGLRDGAGG
jgi:hypothetical protein